MRKFVLAITYGVVLTVFFAYCMLDTFVITRTGATVDTHVGEINQEAIISENYYRDEHIIVNLNQIRQYETEIYVADVIVSSPEYLRAAFAKNTYGQNITEYTSQMAQANGAIFAINGDYYGARENGYVIRNGELYRSSPAGRDTLVIGKDGSFSVVNDRDVSAEELLEGGAMHTISFGPCLVEGGELAVDTDAEIFAELLSNPRAAIGIVSEGHYLFVVSDGRLDDSAGLSLYQLAQVMKQMGAKTAYNLDGGGSATMYFNGRIVNRPAGRENIVEERSVSDIVYVGY